MREEVADLPCGTGHAGDPGRPPRSDPGGAGSLGRRGHMQKHITAHETPLKKENTTNNTNEIKMKLW